MSRIKGKFGFLFNKGYVLEAGNDELIFIRNGKDVMAWIPKLDEIMDLIKEEGAKFNRHAGNLQVYPHEDNLRVVISLNR